jgi:dethiobiotin synthetase
MTVAFITATGTDIGKTFVTTGLIRYFRGSGRATNAIKPVVSGFAAEAWRDSDPALLLAALDRPLAIDELEQISPWRFSAPLSPDMAASRDGRAIVFADLVAFCRRVIAGRRGVVLIEGIGGVMVPLDDRHSVLDWMTLLRVPIVLVAGTYVGTISHTLTALEVLARRNLEIAAVVISESEGSAAPLADTVATLERFASPLEVIGLPRLPFGAEDHPAFARIASLL